MSNKIYIVTEFLSRGHRFLNEKFGSMIKEKAFYSGGLVLNAILDDDTYVSVVFPHQLIGVNNVLHVYIDEEVWRKYKHYLIGRFNNDKITTFREVFNDFVMNA